MHEASGFPSRRDNLVWSLQRQCLGADRIRKGPVDSLSVIHIHDVSRVKQALQPCERIWGSRSDAIKPERPLVTRWCRGAAGFLAVASHLQQCCFPRPAGRVLLGEPAAPLTGSVPRHSEVRRGHLALPSKKNTLRKDAILDQTDHTILRILIKLLRHTPDFPNYSNGTNVGRFSCSC